MNSSSPALRGDDRLAGLGGDALAREAKEEQDTKSVVDARWSLWASGFSLAAASIVALILLLSFCLRTFHADRGVTEIDSIPLLQKPIGDARTYRFSRLDNGLEVVNIYDPAAVTAAYSVAVQAGSWDDPHKIPGLAHFCEHMVFLGSVQFPDASGYDNFVNSHGGYLNAYTAEQTTVYFTEISGAGFAEGLARFADFLQEPLFSPQYMDKEVHAINSEHAKNQQDPSWRLNAVMNSLANPLSPVSRFHTGDDQTLRQEISLPSLERSLRTWFDAHYCPSRMRLVTLSSDSEAQQLEKAKTFFGNMSVGSPVCQQSVETWALPKPWPEHRLGKWVTVLGVQPQPSLVLYFPLPDLTKEFLSQPTLYLNYVLTYGGERSHLTLLRDELGLISGFDIGFESSSAGGGLIAEYSLSERGLQLPGLVLDVFFQYMSTLRSSPVDRDLYVSLANLTKLEWDWSPRAAPADTVSGLAERMTRLPAEMLLSGDSVIKVPDLALVADLMTLLNPENMNALFVTPDAEKRFGNDGVRTLPHYGVKYSVTALSSQFPEGHKLWSRWLSPSGREASEQELTLRLKVAEPFKAVRIQMPEAPGPISDVPKQVSTEHMRADRPEIPGDFATSLFGRQPEPLSLQGDGGGNGGKASNQTSDQASGPAPTGAAVSLAANGTATVTAVPDEMPAEPNMSTWYRAGWVTTSPKVQLSVSLRPWRTQEQWEPGVLDCLRLQLYSSLLAERMAPRLFDDAVVDSSYELTFSSNGIHLAFAGFPSLLSGLVDRVLAESTQGVSTFSRSQFQRVRQDMMEDVRSYPEMPVHYALEDRALLLTTGTHSKEEKLWALERVNLRSVASSTDLLRDPLELTALVMGNVDVVQSRQVLAKAVEGLQNISTVGRGEGEVSLVTPVVRPGRPVELRKQNPRPDDPNHVAVVSLLAGVSTVEGRVLYGLLGQILSQLAYDELRTEKQLGYVVSAGDLQISNVQAVSIVVQGTALDADSTEAAIEKVYFHSMPKRLAELSDEEFQSYKAALKHQLLEPPLNTNEEFSHWWSLVSMHGACLGLRNEMLTYLEKLVDSKQLLVQAWSRLILPEDGVRQKIAVKYFAGQVPPQASKEAATELWKKFGLQGQGLDMLAREREMAVSRESADSTSRAELARLGGYFPRDLQCELSKESKEAKPAVQKQAKLLEEAPLALTQRRLRSSGGRGPSSGQGHEVLAPN